MSYKIPKNQLKAYRNLVDRANYRINKNYQYILANKIEDDTTKRALLHDYTTPRVIEKTGELILDPFSKTTVFDSKEAFEDYKEHLRQWGKKAPKGVKNFEGYARSVKSVRRGYKLAIEDALKSLATKGNATILDKKGRLPAEIRDRIKNMTTEQITNFFDYVDPTEDYEAGDFDSDRIRTDSMEHFVDDVTARMNALTQMFPNKTKPDTEKLRGAKNTPKKKRRKKSKKNKRK